MLQVTAEEMGQANSPWHEWQWCVHTPASNTFSHTKPCPTPCYDTVCVIAQSVAWYGMRDACYAMPVLGRGHAMP